MGTVLAFSPRRSPTPKYLLKLYVAGPIEQSFRLVLNIRKICELLDESCELSIIDVLQEPQLAEQDRIIATPTLVKYGPLPVKRIVGDLSDVDEVLHQIKGYCE
jgi:circadian clock protein KaiB